MDDYHKWMIALYNKAFKGKNNRKASHLSEVRFHSSLTFTLLSKNSNLCFLERFCWDEKCDKLHFPHTRNFQKEYIQFMVMKRLPFMLSKFIPTDLVENIRDYFYYLYPCQRVDFLQEGVHKEAVIEEVKEGKIKIANEWIDILSPLIKPLYLFTTPEWTSLFTRSEIGVGSVLDLGSEGRATVIDDNNEVLKLALYPVGHIRYLHISSCKIKGVKN